jgi:radical SAM superfamily enzyme YgiQ (UPF0313 family)
MKEITLISTSENMFALGVRRLAGFIRKKTGYRVRVIFLAGYKYFHIADSTNHEKTFPDALVEDIVRAVEYSDIVGFSLMSAAAPVAARITEAIKRKYEQKVIIWGGIHPTLDPESCLKTADYVCVGEGEKAFLAFIRAWEDGKDLLTLDGILGKRKGRTMGNPPMPLARNLDELGFPEFGSTDHLVAYRGCLSSLDTRLEKALMGPTFWAFLSQGCPYGCSFCANAALINIRKEYAQVRYYSIPKFIEFMRWMKDRYDLLSVQFLDDVFFDLPKKVIVEFAAQWKERVQLPFQVQGVNPKAFDEGKLDILIGASLRSLRIGLQSGSERVRAEIFNRRYGNDLIVDISRTLSRKNLSICSYDLIVDNPWETRPERLKGLRLLARMTPPFTLNLFSLALFKGTKLSEKALAEGKVGQPDVLADHKIDNDFMNFLYGLYSIIHLPERFLLWLVRLVPESKRIPVPKHLFRGLLYAKYLRLILSRVFRKDPTNVPFARLFFRN